MERLPVYILAGGESSRFGSDKARALVDGQPLIRRIATAVGPVASLVSVVAQRVDQYADLGLRTIADRNGGLGPMAGLQAALHDCDQPWLAMLSCDLVRLRPEWIRILLDARTKGVQAVAFRHTHWEPLVAIYHHDLERTVDERIEQGRRGMQEMLEQIVTAAVVPPPDWPDVTQVNTPEQFAEAFLERQTVTLEVLLFGPAAQAAGTRRIPVQIGAEGITCAALRQRLGALSPPLVRFLPACRLAVNQEFVDDAHVIVPADEVALIGMVSGG